MNSKQVRIVNGTVVKVRNPAKDKALIHIEGAEGEVVGGFELPWGRGWSYTVRVDGRDYTLGEGEIELEGES